MELREVIGRRRSIRFLRPYIPVEPEKIQMMFEAARIATHWGKAVIAGGRHPSAWRAAGGARFFESDGGGLAAAPRAGFDRVVMQSGSRRRTGRPTTPADGRWRAGLRPG